ncbi:MAG: chromosomal replication initiator protein DnaA [Deltaproteobacteria bacterium]|jgi:chromosomal replication initiator protein|nr:chromosomal replication initiator protein DnaA [Deltaproteobacteria bacterium]
MVNSPDGMGDLSISQDKLWPLAKDILATVIPQSTFNVWIDPLLPSFNAENHFVLESPNFFFKSYVQKHFEKEICFAINQKSRELGLGEIIIKFNESVESNFNSPVENAGDSDDYEQFPQYAAAQQNNLLPGFGRGRMLFNPRFTFDNFVVGDPNNLAYQAAKAFSNDQQLGTDILFFISDHGLGKSHLSQALGQVFLTSNPERQVHYLSAEDFTNEMVRALHHHSMEDFKRKYRNECDVLVLEEVTFLAGKRKIQDELCFTLDLLMNQGKKVVMTSTLEPRKIPRLGQSLKSRISSALVAPIGAPDFETRLRILTNLATKTGLKISKPILELLANNIKNDVRQLESCLVNLSAKSNLLNKSVDMTMAQECLDYLMETGSNELALNKILRVICCSFNLDEEDIKSNSRRRNINEARSMGMYLARLMTKHTLEEIGQAFGRRRHSTTLYAINKIEAQLHKDAKLKSRIEYLTSQLSLDQ